MDDSDDEQSGAAKAAAILARMKPENRERLLNELGKRSPQVAKTVSQEIPRLERLLELDPAGIRFLLGEVPHGDLVLSLKLASEQVRYAILTGLTTRRRGQVEADLESAPPVTKTQVIRAQERILQTMERLLQERKIRVG